MTGQEGLPWSKYTNWREKRELWLDEHSASRTRRLGIYGQERGLVQELSRRAVKGITANIPTGRRDRPGKKCP